MPIANLSEMIIATTNSGKTKEFAHKFGSLGVAVQSLADYPDIPPIVEDGSTFMENAEIKARTVAGTLCKPALADDSGLRVEELGGEPGVYSARYAGEHATDAENVEKLLRTLQAAERTFSPPDIPLPEGVRLLSEAEFVCALVFVNPDDSQVLRVEGNCPGYIIDEPRGSNGFGYDPVFYLPQYGKTMAELTLEEKQSISHRGKAMDVLLSLFSQ